LSVSFPKIYLRKVSSRGNDLSFDFSVQMSPVSIFAAQVLMSPKNVDISYRGGKIYLHGYTIEWARKTPWSVKNELESFLRENAWPLVNGEKVKDLHYDIPNTARANIRSRFFNLIR